MTKTLNIDVHHVTRIEGHGNIRVQAANGKVEKVQWQVPEAPRFFEAMLRGRSYQEMQTVVSRICGICSFAHSLASIKATESALGIEVSQQTDRLRLLAFGGEQLESHALHVGYLVAPDLLGVNSVVPLVTSHPEVVLAVIRAHRLGNEWMELLGGRRTHPVSFRPGGFGKLPREAELRELKAKLEKVVPDLTLIAKTVAALAGNLPAFERPTEYIALVQPGVYTFYHGKIGSTDTADRLPVSRFEEVANEYVTGQSTAKWTKWHRDAYAVGALARFNLNHAHLHPLAAQTAKMLGLKAAVLQSVYEQRGAGGGGGGGGGSGPATDRRSADGGDQARAAAADSAQGRHRRRRGGSAARDAVPQVHVRRQRAVYRGERLHPHQPESREHPEGFRGAGAEGHGQGRGQGPSDAGDAGARVRSVRVVLDALAHGT